jgi:hypothetical protein
MGSTPLPQRKRPLMFTTTLSYAKLVAIPIGLSAIAILLTGCASDVPAGETAATASATATKQATIRAAEVDSSVNAACGQASALLSIQVNAQVDSHKGSIDADAYSAQLRAVQFQFQQIPQVSDPLHSFSGIQAYFSGLGSTVYNPDDDAWGKLQQKVVDSCRSANSPISISQSNGG